MPEEQLTCLHIGMPKTGTTTFQKRLYPRHSEIFYLGKFYPPQPYFLNQDIEAIISKIRDQSLAEAEIPAYRARYQQLVAAAEGKMVVWSDEEATLTSHARLKQRARNYRDIFGTCRILITVRSPMAYVQSLHRHLVTTYQVDRNRKLMTKALKRSYWEKPKFLTMEQWLETVGYCPGESEKYGLNNLIDVASVAEIFAEVFGDEQIGIFLFEQMVNDLPGYIDRIAEFLSIDSKECLDYLGGHKDASAVSAATVSRMKNICASPWRTALFRSAPQWLRNQMAGVAVHPGSSLAVSLQELEIPDLWQDRILSVAHDSQQRISQRWQVPFDQFDYPR